jgi:hypothetical protein
MTAATGCGGLTGSAATLVSAALPLPSALLSWLLSEVVGLVDGGACVFDGRATRTGAVSAAGGICVPPAGGVLGGEWLGPLPLSASPGVTEGVPLFSCGIGIVRLTASGATLGSGVLSGVWPTLFAPFAGTFPPSFGLGIAPVAPAFDGEAIRPTVTISAEAALPLVLLLALELPVEFGAGIVVPLDVFEPGFGHGVAS